MSQTFWYSGQQVDAATVFFLPGWGFSGRVLDLAANSRSEICSLESGADPISLPGDLLDYIDSWGIGKIKLAGWSMGGYLALDFALKNPARVSELVLISMRTRWPKTETDAIRQEFSRDPESFMRLFYRKCFLGDKVLQRRFIEELERQYLDKIDSPLLMRGLDYLEGFSATKLPEVPVTLIHGKRDVISPVSEMPEFSGVKPIIYDNSGHSVFLGAAFHEIF